MIKMTDQLTFTQMHLERATTLRKSPEWLTKISLEPSTSLILIWRSRYFFDNNELFQVSQKSDIGQELLALANEQVFLGLDKDNDNAAIFVVDISSVSEEELFTLFSAYGYSKVECIDFRTSLGQLSFKQASILSYAKSLTHWHRAYQYCGYCGAKTKNTEAGHSRICTHSACNKQSFPRTDPVVIMLVEYQPKQGPAMCLLGNHVKSPDNLYSTLAGFVDPGESIEEAVKREVFEEAGIEVGEVDYISSQPWPFPNSLMLGFFAKALSTEVSIDQEELKNANWFTAEQVRAFDNWGDQVHDLLSLYQKNT